MPDYKKVRAIENFENIARSIDTLKKEVLTEHEILFGKTLDTIESRILENKKRSLSRDTKLEMQALRSSL